MLSESVRTRQVARFMVRVPISGTVSGTSSSMPRSSARQQRRSCRARSHPRTFESRAQRTNRPSARVRRLSSESFQLLTVTSWDWRLHQAERPACFRMSADMRALATAALAETAARPEASSTAAARLDCRNRPGPASAATYAMYVPPGPPRPLSPHRRTASFSFVTRSSLVASTGRRRVELPVRVLWSTSVPSVMPSVQSGDTLRFPLVRRVRFWRLALGASRLARAPTRTADAPAPAPPRLRFAVG